MSFSYGLHVENNYDLAATLMSPAMDKVYETVLQVNSGLPYTQQAYCS
jgi:hypothetical protein